MTLATWFALNVRAAASKVVGVNDSARDSLDHLATPINGRGWASGTGANQADKSYHRSSSLAASATDSIDFASGALVDAFGDSANLARVKMLFIENTSAEGGASITIGGTNGAAAAVTLAPGGVYFAQRPDATAWPCTNGSSDTITITNASGSVAATYRAIVVGATA